MPQKVIDITSQADWDKVVSKGTEPNTTYNPKRKELIYTGNESPFDMNTKTLKPCRDCRQPLGTRARWCPQCGAPTAQDDFSNIAGTLIGLVLLACLIYFTADFVGLIE